MESVVPFILLAVFYKSVFSLKPKNVECLQNGPCTCVYPSSDVLDLSHLVENNSYLTTSNGSVAYFYNPCEDFKFNPNTTETALLWKFEAAFPSNKSLDTSSIIKGEISGNYTAVANSGTVEFQSTFLLNNQAYIISTKKDEQSIITLECSESTTAFELGPAKKDQVNSLKLKSPASCTYDPMIVVTPDHISTGSILLLLFFIVGGVYFIGGALALKYLRGAEGLEMIPNYDFWRELPSLIKNRKRRRMFLQLARRDLKTILSLSRVFMCEVYFDMDENTINYKQYQMGFSQKNILGRLPMPSKFLCHDCNDLIEKFIADVRT